MSGKSWLPNKWGKKGKVYNLTIVILLIDYHSPNEMLYNKISSISVAVIGVEMESNKTKVSSSTEL